MNCYDSYCIFENPFYFLFCQTLGHRIGYSPTPHRSSIKTRNITLPHIINIPDHEDKKNIKFIRISKLFAESQSLASTKISTSTYHSKIEFGHKSISI